MKDLNPISIKILALIQAGKTTKEKLCVALDIRYPTLQNLFGRNRASYSMRRALKYGGLITDAEEREYFEWLAKQPKSTRKKNPPGRITAIKESA